ncbi:MAG: RICIN domain-containing protein [Devosiaceae bacterium]|nr:RICIN domain-containing protein [Devosiaceae bacterium]
MKTPKLFNVIAAATFMLVASTITAFAVPATAKSAVNVRSGPGVTFAKVDALHAGQAVNVTECQGGWCYVEKTGPDGWVSGNFLQAVEAAPAAPAPAPSAADDAAAAAAIEIFGAIAGAIINNSAPPPPAPPAPPPAPEPAPVQLNGVYTIQQVSNGRYLDAYTSPPANFSNPETQWNIVTRPRQFDATQAWIITPLGGGVFTLQQQSTNRYLDAHTSAANDWSAVTRPSQNNNTQRWILTSLGNDTYTIQQRSNGRYLDAHSSAANDWSAVTRPNQNNNTQRWIIK